MFTIIPVCGIVPFPNGCTKTSHWVSEPPAVQDKTPWLLTAKFVGCGQVTVPQLAIPVKRVVFTAPSPNGLVQTILFASSLTTICASEYWTPLPKPFQYKLNSTPLHKKTV